MASSAHVVAKCGAAGLAGAALLAAALGPARGAAAPCPPARGAYATAVLAAGAVAYYPLSESSGPTLCDLSSSAQNGTFATSGVRHGVPGALTALTAVRVGAP